MTIVKIILCFLLTTVFLVNNYGCSASSETVVNEAIQSANIYLTNRQCDKAVKLLESVGRQNENALYLQVLASAYACRAGFEEPNLVANDLSNIGTPSELGGFTLFSTSAQMYTYDTDEYLELQTAIDILLYAGGLRTTQNPTSARRLEKFNSSDAGNIDTQLLYMLMAQLGMYLYHYGSTDSTGEKAADGATVDTKCIVTYDDTIVLKVGIGNLGTLLNSLGPGVGDIINPCTNGKDGHSDFGAAGGSVNGSSDTTRISRLCEGVVLLNNFFDVLFGTIGSAMSTDDFDAINDIKDEFETILGAVIGYVAGGDEAAMQRVLDTTSQTRCEAENSTDKFLQIYFATIMETLFDEG